MARDADGEFDRPAAFLCFGGGNDFVYGRRMSGDDDLSGGVFDREGHGMLFAVNPPAQLLHRLSLGRPRMAAIAPSPTGTAS